MPRFGDNWVVDRTLFEFISGGSCNCCGFRQIFNPEGLAGLIKEVTDLETDAARNELSAAKRSPWPPEMRDQVWADRVRLRHKMKREMGRYKAFWEGGDDDGWAGKREEVERFCREEIGVKNMAKILMMPRSEVTEKIHSHYAVHSAFGNVLNAVMEQVANFKVTKYETDARGPAEIKFEENLLFDRRGGFMLPILNRQSNSFDERIFTIFIDMMMSLAGPKLLMRGPKTSKDNEEDGGEAGEEMLPGAKGPSFRSDRRLIRLLIAKYWSDEIMKRFNKWKGVEEEEEVKGDEGDGKDNQVVKLATMVADMPPLSPVGSPTRGPPVDDDMPSLSPIQGPSIQGPPIGDNFIRKPLSPTRGPPVDDDMPSLSPIQGPSIQGPPIGDNFICKEI